MLQSSRSFLCFLGNICNSHLGLKCSAKGSIPYSLCWWIPHYLPTQTASRILGHIFSVQKNLTLLSKLSSDFTLLYASIQLSNYFLAPTTWFVVLLFIYLFHLYLKCWENQFYDLSLSETLTQGVREGFFTFQPRNIHVYMYACTCALLWIFTSCFWGLTCVFFLHIQVNRNS
jgi:hypothetical protein